MSFPADSPITVTLVDPGGLTAGVGARVEVPVTRQIVSYWRPATLTDAIWTVTLDGVPSPGLYNLVWMAGVDPSPYEITVPLEVVAELPDGPPVTDYPDVDRSQIQPSLAEVGMLEHTRTQDQGGTEKGTFDSTTRPSASDVTALIDEATDDVLAQLVEQFDPKHYGQVKRAVALQTAIMIEGSFFREQSNDAAVQLWERMLVTVLTAVQTQIAADLEDRYAADGAGGAILV